MKKNRFSLFIHFLLIALPIIISASCANLESLSDDTGIIEFNVDTIYTPSVERGEPIIHDSTHVIEIPLVYGRYEPSIAIGASAIANPKALKILGLDSDSVVFRQDKTQQFSKYSFYVMAENGDTKEWTIQLSEVPRSNSNDILDFTITSAADASAFYDPVGFIYNEGDRPFVKILAPHVSFPFTITFAATVSDSATIVDKPADNTLTFENRLDFKKLTVKADDGKQQEWFVYVETAEQVDEANNNTYIDRQAALNIANLSITASAVAQGNIKQYSIDSVNNEILLELKDTAANFFPFKFGLDFEQRPNMALIGYERNDELVYTSVRDEHYFYLYDRLENLKKRWNVRIQKWLSNAADVTDFKITRVVPGEITIESDIEIDQQRGMITLEVSDGKDEFPLTARAVLEVSENAIYRNFVNNADMVFETIDSQKTFQVIAEDGTIKEWTIACIFSGELNTEAEVEENGFTITEYTSTNNKVELDKNAIVSSADSSITISVTNWANFFPVRLKANMLTSRKSTFVDGAFGSNDWLEFNDINATYSFTLRSQDTFTTKRWTIKFVNNEGEKSDAAELISFKANSLANGYVSNRLNIDQASKTITIGFTKLGSGNVSFRPQIGLSPKASLKDISNGAQLTFNKFEDVKTFKIVSESGTVENEWKIKLSYEPQLPNNNFESWASSGPATPTGWDNANMNGLVTVANTKSAASPKGGLCVYMKTGETSGKLAAGSNFLGYFKFTSLSDALNNPTKMTFFGVPFTARPTSVTFDYYYKRGGSSDYASCNIQLLNCSGTSIEYHGTSNVGDKTGNVTVLAGNFIKIDNTEWTTKTFPINYDAVDGNLPVTHIHVAFSSSWKGDKFQGDKNSLLMVDNVILGYE